MYSESLSLSILRAKLRTHTQKKCKTKSVQGGGGSAPDRGWDEYYEATSVNTAWQRLKSILLPLAENHIPQRTSSSTIPPKPWITAEIRALIREKHRLYRRYKKKRCPEAWEKYGQVRNAVRSHLKKAKSLFVLNRLADALSHANDLP